MVCRKLFGCRIPQVCRRSEGQWTTAAIEQSSMGDFPVLSAIFHWFSIASICFHWCHPPFPNCFVPVSSYFGWVDVVHPKNSNDLEDICGVNHEFKVSSRNFHMMFHGQCGKLNNKPSICGWFIPHKKTVILGIIYHWAYHIDHEFVFL